MTIGEERRLKDRTHLEVPRAYRVCTVIATVAVLLQCEEVRSAGEVSSFDRVGRV
jgi:hypothetical protein